MLFLAGFFLLTTAKKSFLRQAVQFTWVLWSLNKTTEVEYGLIKAETHWKDKNYFAGRSLAIFSSPTLRKNVCIRSYWTEYGVSLSIQFECEKIRTRITPNTDTFYAVLLAQKQKKGYTNEVYTTLKLVWIATS